VFKYGILLIPVAVRFTTFLHDQSHVTLLANRCKYEALVLALYHGWAMKDRPKKQRQNWDRRRGPPRKPGRTARGDIEAGEGQETSNTIQ